MATISSVYARVVARSLVKNSADEARLFEGTPLSSARLWSEAEIDLHHFHQLLCNAEAMSPEIPVGFLIGNQHGTHALGHLGVAMNAAPGLRAGLQVLQSFTAIHTTYIRIHLDTGIHGIFVRLEFSEEAHPVELSHTEASMMLFRRYIETQTTREFPNGEYQFSYPRPAHHNRYAEHLAGTQRFDSSRTGLFLPNDLLSIRSPFYNAEIWSQSMRLLNHRLKELGATDQRAFERHVRLLLRSHTPPLPSLEEMADQLHVSSRTLNRRLQQEGTSYRELRADLMNEWSKSYLLETDNSVESISAAMGYSDVANFRRAFRSRNGMSLRDFRQRHGSAK